MKVKKIALAALVAFGLMASAIPAQADTGTTAPLWWPWAALAGVVIAAWIVRRRRKTHRELDELANRNFGF